MAKYNFKSKPPAPLVPDGWYLAQIVSSAIKDTRSGNGKVLTITFSLLGKDDPKQLVCGRFNVENPSENAMDYAMQKLSMLSESVGKPMWNNTRELHGIPLGIMVSSEPRRGVFPARNNVDAYCLEEEVGKAVQDSEVTVRTVKVKKGKKGERPSFTDENDMPF